MPRTTTTRTIHASLEEVWPVLADLANTADYNPAVARSFTINDQPSGLGARRRCDISADGKKFIEEEAVAFDAEGRSYTMSLVGGTAKPPIDTVQVTVSCEAAGPDATTVTMHTELAGNGLVQKAMALAATPMMRRVSGQVLDGLDAHVSA